MTLFLHIFKKAASRNRQFSPTFVDIFLHIISRTQWNQNRQRSVHQTKKLLKMFDKKKTKKNSVEPESNQRPMDYCFNQHLQSTALPTELSTDAQKCPFKHISSAKCRLRICLSHKRDIRKREKRYLMQNCL